MKKHCESAPAKSEKVGPQTHQPRQGQGLVQFFAKSPLAKVKIKLKRKREFARKIEL